MENYRSKGFSVDFLIEMTEHEGDHPAVTRLEKLQFMAEGSPTLRFIFSQMRDYVSIPRADGTPQKLIICEDTPIVAWFWEIALCFLYIETRVLHSGLTNSERSELVDSFNSPAASIKVLILMYNVGSQGTNLDTCCNRVLVATAATNASLEVQAWGRATRVRCLPPKCYKSGLLI